LRARGLDDLKRTPLDLVRKKRAICGRGCFEQPIETPAGDAAGRVVYWREVTAGQRLWYMQHG